MQHDDAAAGDDDDGTVEVWEWISNLIFACMWLLIHDGTKGKPC